jgi:hypothetical protein
LRPALDPATLVMPGIALALVVVAYLKDPGLPLLGAKTGLSLPWTILPRLVPALILAGTITPGGPMVTVPSLAFPVIAGWLVAAFYQE